MNTFIVRQILWQNAGRDFSDHSQTFDFSIRYGGINFHSPKELSKSLLIQEHWTATILFEISTFFNPPALWSLQRVSCFVLGEEIFRKKAFCIFLSLLTMFQNSFYKWLENNFWLENNLTIFPSSVSFLIFNIFKTRWISATTLKNFFSSFNFLL